MLSCVALFLGIGLAFIFGAVISSKIKIKDRWLNIINKFAAVLFFFFGVKLFLFAIENIEKLFSII
jgi:putative Ca2+/H+ antiporter (TMEM165/GDT1 family)